MNAPIHPRSPARNATNTFESDGHRPTSSFSLHNFEAEQSVLGSILVHGAIVDRVMPFLRCEHFADPLHARLYAEMLALRERSHPISWATLRAWIEEDCDWRSVGGRGYLIALVRVAVPPTEAETYGRLVAEMHSRRALVELAHTAPLPRVEASLLHLGGNH